MWYVHNIVNVNIESEASILMCIKAEQHLYFSTKEEDKRIGKRTAFWK